MEVVEILKNLQLSALSDEWITETIQNEFLSCQPLEEFENQLRESPCYLRTLETARSILKRWLRTEKDGESDLWTVFMEHEVPHKALLALLCYLMELTEKRTSDGVLLQAGLEAAGVYLTLVMIPGSGAFRIFHQVLFEKATNCFKLWKKISTLQQESSDSSLCSQSSQSGKGKKRGRQSQRSQEQSEEDGEESLLSPRDIAKVDAKLLTLLKTFVALLERYPLKDGGGTGYTAVRILADLSKQDAETFAGDFTDDPDTEKLRTVPELCYRGLELLCTEKHGNVPTMIRNVLQSLMPNLLMLVGDNQDTAAQTIHRELKLIKEHALDFVCHLMKSRQAELHGAVRILVQHLCDKVPDKADYRNGVAKVVITLLMHLPGRECASLIEWIYRFGRHAKTSHRIFALDIACLLLNEKEREGVPDGDYSAFATHTFLLQMLIARCSDVAASVRARAIIGLAQCLASTQPSLVSAVQCMMTPDVTASRPALTRLVPTPDAQRQTEERPDNTDDFHMPEVTGETSDTVEEASDSVKRHSSRKSLEMALATLQSRPRDPAMMTIQLTPGADITLTDSKGVVSMLRRRVRDEKVNVRKAALVAMESLIRLNSNNINKQDVEKISDSCRDQSLMVRKQAMASLTQLLLDLPLNVTIQRMFLRGVLPMVADREPSAQEKCLSTCADVIVANIVPLHRSTDDHHKMAWALLRIIVSQQNGEHSRYLSKCCLQWHRSKFFNKQHIDALKTHIGTDHNREAWMMLSKITTFFRNFRTDFVLDYWTNAAKTATESEYPVVKEVLRVLGHISKQVPQDRISDITADLKARLLEFTLPIELISATVTALNKLCGALAGDTSTTSTMAKLWFVDLLKASDRYLSSVILSEDPKTQMDEEKIVCHLFTLGEVAQLCPDKTPKRIFMLVQSLISTPVITSSDGSSQIAGSQKISAGPANQSDNQPNSQPSSQSHSQTEGPVTTPDISSISNDSQTSRVQTSGLSQGSQFTPSGVLSQFRGSTMPPRIRAHAFLTLGKLCLQHDDIARKCVPAMVRELEVCADAPVRNNVVIILCDLCVRYTHLIDSYIPKISACIKDESVLVRKQTLVVLTRLLQEEYIKWKDSLFFRFVASVVDDCEEVRQFGRYSLEHLIQQRHPAMFYQHFVEAIFHFNAYDDHKVYNKFPQTEREQRMFSLKEPNCFEKREQIYKFLLKHMTDEEKFHLNGKLCHDVLGAVVDDVIPYNADTVAILKDTFSILCSKEIKLTSLKAKSAVEVETEKDMAHAVVDAARRKALTRVVKTNVMENIIPTVVSLKHLLEEKLSPVQQHLMLYLRELMKDYRHEMQDILAGDRQLASEIEFDLRRFEEQEEARRKAEQGRHRTPQARTTPRTPRTPRNAGDVQGTPSRNVPMSLARQALVSATKKTLEQINTARKAREEAADQETSVGRAEDARPRKKVAFSQSVDSRDPTGVTSPAETVDADPPQTPKQTPPRESDKGDKQKPGSSHARAISTPAANLTFTNITFMDPDISTIPSPIPTRLTSSMSPPPQAGSPRWTKQKVTDPVTGVACERDVLLMMSPDAEEPRPTRPTLTTQSPPHRVVQPQRLDYEQTTPLRDVSNTSEERRRSGRIAAKQDSSTATSPPATASQAAGGGRKSRGRKK